MPTYRKPDRYWDVFKLRDLFFALLGKGILFLKYKNKERVHLVLEQKYEGSYAQSGYAMIWRIIQPFLLWIVVLSFIGFVIFMVMLVFRDYILN